MRRRVKKREKEHVNDKSLRVADKGRRRIGCVIRDNKERRPWEGCQVL